MASIPTEVNNIHGIIYDNYNAPLAGVTVEASDKDLRSEQLLASAITDANGTYSISYTNEQYAASDFETADIFIRVYEIKTGSAAATPIRTLLGQSPVYFNVPADFTLNFKIDNTAVKPLNEFDRLISEIQPLLVSQNVQIKELKEDNTYTDISFLAGETGEDFNNLSLVPLAYQTADSIKIDVAIFYGLFRMQFPTDFNTLLQIKSESIANGISAAISENIISAKWQSQISSIINLFNEYAVNTLTTGTDAKSTAVQKVLSNVLTTQQQSDFINVYLANENTPDTFWDTLSKQSGFTDGKVVNDLKNALQLNMITSNEPSLTTLIFNNQKLSGETDIRSIASLSQADWKTQIDSLVTSGDLKDFPNVIEGDTTEEKSANYAAAIYQTVKTLYPTDIFASELNKNTNSSFQSANDLKTFLASNIDFDLKTTTINTSFKAANITGIKDADALKNDLTTISRLHKLTDEYSNIDILNASKLNSATAIVQTLSASQFAAKFADSISLQDATSIYKNAQQVDKRSTAFALSIKTRNDIPVFAITGADNNASPDYESMFGDTNCDCEECQSVYGPSAYLTDILHFLQQNNSAAFDLLTSRRPDIPHTLLTCENTNTPLPYIDLVNEILENTIAPQTDNNGNPVFPQTTNTAEELAAYPEYVNTDAYKKLAVANSSHNLPLNLSLEETRIYLDKAGIKRFALMELFFGKNNLSKYNDLSIAAEYLKLNNEELNIFNGTTALPVTLNSVTAFLNDTGLTYIETLQLLECYFINPLNENGERNITIVAAPGFDAATCNINQLQFQSTSSQSFKVIPFIRLWKKTGWNIFDLDSVFTALNITDFTGDINNKFIIPLSHIARLKDRFHITIQTFVSFWADINIDVYHDHSAEGQPKIPTQYESLFQNKKITNPVDADFSNPLSLSGTLAAKAPVIIAALNLSQTDFDTLSNAPFTDGNLNLKNLSIIYSYTLLARTLNLSIDDLISLINITALHPVTDITKINDTLTFIDKVGFIKSTGFSVADLNIFLGNTADITQSVNADDINKVLLSIREGLQKIDLLVPVGSTTDEQAANKKANQNSLITNVLATAFKTESKVVDVLINDLVKVPAGGTTSAFDFFVNADFINSAGTLFTTSTDGEIVWKFPDLVNAYIALNNTWTRISNLLSKWKISNDEFIYFEKNQSAFNISGIWNLPVPGVNLYPAFENLFNLILFRNALIIQAADWYTLFDVVILNNANAKKNFVDSLLSVTNITLNEANALLGSEMDNNDTGALKISFPADYFNACFLLQAINCSKTAAKLGSTAGKLFSLTINPVNEDFSIEADLAKSILKSKYDESSWLQIITSISNQLRIKKRDALVSFILTDAAFDSFRTSNIISDTNSLFAYFLIDIEMDACMMTSRIKQAISGIQLFIDRCLMNLENGIALNNDFADQWNVWRKQYRVWEANREIFLYPENWIEPELRDDKSPFFKDLESALKQNEVTEDTATNALLAYLENLDAVANLEIIGLFPDELTNIVHVIGETRNLPHQYYYTRQTNGNWSAWEKMDLDIEGDHILPVVWNNRLMLFWALFASKQASNENGFQVPNAGDIMPPPVTYLEIKLAWSEYKNGTWKPKKQSKDIISTEPFLLGTMNPTVIDISLSSSINNGDLNIRVFIPYRTDLNDVFLVSMGGFNFDGCNNSPAAYTNTNFDILNGAWKILNTDLDEMFIKESSRQDSFALYDSGIYLPVLSTANNKETTIFNNTPGNFQLLPNHHEIEIIKPISFFYNNGKNNFYSFSVEKTVRNSGNGLQSVSSGLLIERRTVNPVIPPQQNMNTTAINQSNQSVQSISNTNLSGASSSASAFSSVVSIKLYLFQIFYHPRVCEFIKTLNTDGIDGLYKNLVVDIDGTIKEGIQNKVAVPTFISNGDYDPSTAVAQPYPVEEVDFNISSIYSIYNWELFFHIPLLIATSLSQNQQFEAARKWFHYIFDPTQSSTDQGAERFWMTKPFKEEIEKGILSIEDLVNDTDKQNELNIELTNWESNPFNPHAVARFRNSAYMRCTVMKYIDNLIVWGDQLFTTNTIESINEATLLYVLAANILGQKPGKVPARAVAEQYSYSNIQDKLDSFSNAKVAIQSFISLSDFNSDNNSDSNVLMPMFCIPKNDVLLSYWDTIADRLFKIRHCLNIEGVFQQLPLFEPPIDPGLLVRAAAAGVDLNSILTDMTVTLPNYRFQVMLQKANELCNDVKTLGSELLSALEKNDAEQLSLIRSGQELNLLNAIRDIKLSQIDEANANLESLNNSKDVIQARRDYYSSREYINVYEAVYLASIPTAMVYQNMAIGAQSIAAIVHSIPQVTIGPFSSGATYGGDNMGHALTAAAASFSQFANLFNTIATVANVMGGFSRRNDEWTFQTQSADLELKQMDKQIAAAEIRIAIAQNDLENHDLQISQSTQIDAFLYDKFSNEELYNYMVEQISTLYFQSYQIAYNTAKQAEKCFQYELGLENTSFIQFGYWDSLKKGLLSGEKLQYDLRRLENAYLQQNKREFEITKHISLALINPLAILQLKETGQCSINLPEELFDLDFPGHYFRSMKSVSLSIPCISGPYTTVSATLRLNSSEYRINSNTDNGYAKVPDNETRFRSINSGVTAIATSSAQMDSGMFELNFRDERYLPFEGAGAASTWSLELMTDPTLRQFNYETISDVIIHLRYTARDGVDTDFKNAAIQNLRDVINNAATNGMPLSIAFDMKHDFADEWHQFINDTGTADTASLAIDISKDMLPFFAANQNVEVSALSIYAKKKDTTDRNAISFNSGQALIFDEGNPDSVNLFKTTLSGLSADITDANDFTYSIQMDKTTITSIDNMFIVVLYKLS